MNMIVEDLVTTYVIAEEIGVTPFTVGKWIRTKGAPYHHKDDGSRKVRGSMPKWIVSRREFMVWLEQYLIDHPRTVIQIASWNQIDGDGYPPLEFDRSHKSRYRCHYLRPILNELYGRESVGAWLKLLDGRTAKERRTAALERLDTDARDQLEGQRFFQWVVLAGMLGVYK